MKKRLDKYISAVCMLVLAASLTGCNQAKVPETVTETSLVISDKGIVTSYLADVLDKDYYDVSDLTAMAIQEVADYNAEHQKGEVIPVTMEKVATFEGNKVVVTHKYDSADTYSDYNDSILYYGLFSDAVGNVCDRIDPNLVNVKDGTKITEEQLQSAQENKHVIITDAKAVIYCPYGVSYVSEGAVYREDGTVDTSNTEGTVMILMKK